MKLELNQQDKPIFDFLARAAKAQGVEAYVVGGYVRDHLLGRVCKDIDVVCVGSGIDLAHKTAELMPGKPKVAFFKNFGTAMLRYKDMEVEFVGARKESYRSESRKPTVEDGTLDDDQKRRDFTINALAISLNPHNYGELVDPFGGVNHLELGYIDTPLDPHITFSDDPLRMLRAIRFAAQLNFRIAPRCLDAIYEQRARIKIISMERVRVEMEKMLASRKPSVGFKLLYELGLLEFIFPELLALKGAEEQEGMGHKDNFFHTLQVVDNIAPKTDNIWLRWAALLHDIGKPPTKRFVKGEGWTFHGHDAVGARMVPKIFAKLTLPLDHKMRYVQNLVAIHQRPIALTKEGSSDSAIRRIIVDAGEDLEDLITLCRADITSRNEHKVRRYLANYDVLVQRIAEVCEKDQLRNWQPPITGEIIMSTFGIPPGRSVGIVKLAVREAILDGIIPNDFDAAFGYMLEQGKALGLEVVNQ